MFTYMCVYIHLFARAHTHAHVCIYIHMSVDLFIASAPARPFSSPSGASVRLRLPERRKPNGWIVGNLEVRR